MRRGWFQLTVISGEMQRVFFRGAAVAVSLAVSLAASVPNADARLNPKKAIWGPAFSGGRSLFPVYRQLGVGMLNLALDWSYVARRRPKHPRDPKDPAYFWTDRIVDSVNGAGVNGMRVMIEITHAPSWANGGRTRFWAPNKDSDFADFAVAAARRFPRVHLWMVWGEPSRVHSFQPYEAAEGSARSLTRAQAAGPRKYARLVDATYGALKKLNKSNLIIAGNTFTTGSIRPPLWIKYMRLPNGLPPRMDLYGHNPFSDQIPNLSRPIMDRTKYDNWRDFSDAWRLHREVLANLAVPRHKKKMDLFFAEYCVTTKSDAEFHYTASPARQAEFVTNAFRILNAPVMFGIRRKPFIYSLGWIYLKDTPSSSCGLLNADGSKKPAFDAFASG